MAHFAPIPADTPARPIHAISSYTDGRSLYRGTYTDCIILVRRIAVRGVVSLDPIRPSAVEFVAAARRFVAVVDGREGMSAEEFLLTLHPLLAELTFRASVLPDVWSDHDSPEDRMTHDDWSRLFRSLSDYLGDRDVYWQVFDPVELGGDDPMRGFLADDLADIYRDLKPGLEAVAERRGRIPKFVVWEWRFGFFSHWGHHAINAMRTIHALISYHELGEEEDVDEAAQQSV
jgi:hypothetical protein